MKMKVVIALGTATAAAVGFLILRTPAQPETPPANQQAARQDPASPQGPHALPLSRAGRKGNTQGPPSLDGQYALNYRMSLSQTTDKEATGELDQETARLQLSGTLHIRSEQDESGRHWLAGTLEAAGLQQNAAMARLTDFPTEGLATSLAQPFIVEVTPQGKVKALRCSQGQSLAERGLLANLVQLSQLVPDAAGRSRWSSVEWSINGPTLAHYRRLEDGSLNKRWSYHHDIEHPADPEIQVGQQELVGETQLQLRNRTILGVRADQGGSSLVPQAGESTGFALHLDLQRRGLAKHFVAPAPETLAVFDPATLDIQLPPEAAPPIDQALAQLTRDAADWQKRIQARQALARRLILEPKLAPRLAMLFRDFSQTEPVKRSLIEALVEAADSREAKTEAQLELGKLLVDRGLPDRERGLVLGGVAQMHAPEENTLNTLAVAAYSTENPLHASQTAMVLGAAIARTSETNLDLAKEFLGPFLVHAAEAVAPPEPGAPQRLEERSNWLGALGNVRSPNAFPIIEQALADPRPEIRTSAAHALRFQDPYDSRQLIQQHLAEDASIYVRAAMLHAARTMGPEYMKSVVEKALHHDGSEHVRLEAAYSVAAWGIEAPGMRAILVKALDEEKSLRVREALRSYINRNRVAPPLRAEQIDNPLIPADYPGLTGRGEEQGPNLGTEEAP